MNLKPVIKEFELKLTKNQIAELNRELDGVSTIDNPTYTIAFQPRRRVGIIKCSVLDRRLGDPLSDLVKYMKGLL